MSLEGLRHRLRQGVSVKIYPDTKLDLLNDYLRTKSGVSAIVLSLCLGLIFITVQLLIVQMQKTEHLSGGWAIPSAAGIAVFAEIVTYAAAVNGWVAGSMGGVVFSVFVLRGTFGSQYFDNNEIRFFDLDTWNYPYLLSWILSIMFPIIVGYLSHKVREKIDLEEMAKDKLRETDPEKYRELFGNF
jgi:hypothetical protein